MATFFLREHNRLAGHILYLNPHWSDERLYQETRRLVIALYQKFVYADFLPLLLGPTLMSKFKLNVLDKGYLHDYNNYIYPNVFNEFTTAAYRLHNFIADQQRSADLNLCQTRNNEMTVYYFGALFGYRFQSDLCRGMLLTESSRTSYTVAHRVNFEYSLVNKFL